MQNPRPGVVGHHGDRLGVAREDGQDVGAVAAVAALGEGVAVKVDGVQVRLRADGQQVPRRRVAHVHHQPLVVGGDDAVHRMHLVALLAKEKKERRNE